MTATAPAARVAAAARCTWGFACLARPGHVVRVAGSTTDTRATWFARVLGARELAQGLTILAAPAPTTIRIGVAVDVLHALTAVGLAGLDGRRRRPALLNAAAATAWALIGSMTDPSAREHPARRHRGAAALSTPRTWPLAPQRRSR